MYLTRTFLVFLLALGAVFCTHAQPMDNTVLDLLSAKTWVVEGSTSTPTQLTVTGIGRTINLNGNPRTVVHNPPIDVLGSTLGFNNLFDIKFTLALDVKEGAAVKLYGNLPKIYNGGLVEGDYVEIGIGQGNLTGKVCLETACFVEATAPLQGRAPYSITFDLQKGSFTISGIDSYFPSSSIFDNGRLYFGFDVAFTKTLEISGLVAEGAVQLLPAHVTPKVRRDPALIGALAQRLNRVIPIGVGVATIPLLTEKAYWTTVGKYFTEISPQTAMQFEFIHTQEGIYAYQDADAIADFAQANGIGLHCGSLVWSENVPPWVNTTVSRSNEEIAAILREHITTVVSHFKGKCKSWDVMTNPIDARTMKLSASVWQKALGGAFAQSVFRWAKQADPDALLYVNEFGIETASPKANALLQLLATWKSEGVAIDGVGMKFDGSISDPSRKQVADMFKDFAAISLRVRVSEIRSAKPSPGKTQPSVWFYANALQACVEAPNCAGFSAWGLTDKYSNIGNNLLFDTNYKPKPPVFALLKYLSTLVTTGPPAPSPEPLPLAQAPSISSAEPPTSPEAGAPVSLSPPSPPSDSSTTSSNTTTGGNAPPPTSASPGKLSGIFSLLCLGVFLLALHLPSP